MEIRRFLSQKVILAGFFILIGQLVFFLIIQLDGQSLSEAIKENRSYYWKVENLRQMTMEEVLQRGKWDASEVFKKARYLAAFPDSIQSILDNAQNAGRFSIFQNADSYSYKNIQRTAEEFAKLQGVTLTLDHDKATGHILEYPYLSLFAYGFMVYVIYELLRERDNGMWLVTHAMKKGRYSLAVRRGIGLAVMTVGFYLLLFLGNLVVSCLLYGVDNFGGYMQTLSEYALYPNPLSKGGYLALFALRSSMAVITLVLLSYCVFTVVPDRNFSVVILLGVLTVEWQLRERIAVFDKWNMLRYVNLASLFDCGTFDREYKNLNLFGNAVSASFLLQLTQILLFLLTFGAAVVVYGKSYPREKRVVFRKLMTKMSQKAQRWLGAMGMPGKEVWKVWISQKGILLLALLLVGSIWITKRTEVTMPTLYQQMDQIYREYGGGNWGLFNGYVSNLERRRQELIQRAEILTQLLQEGKVGAETMSEIGVLRSEEDTLRKMVEEFHAKQQLMQSINSRQGILIYAMSDRGYNELIGDNGMLRECVMVILLNAAAILWAVQAFEREKKSFMSALIKSTSRGRGWLWRRKTGVILGMITGTLVLIYGGIWGSLIRKYQLTYLDAPIQSLTFLSHNPARLTIGQFLLLQLMARVLTVTGGVGCALFLASLRGIKNQMYVPFLIVTFSLVAVLEVLFAPVSTLVEACVGMSILAMGGIVGSHLNWCGRKSNRVVRRRKV